MKRTRISEQVASRLESLIRQGVWKPGDLLPSERELAQQFGVSRTAIRDALRSLEILGWIAIRQGEGTRVRGSWSGLERFVSHALERSDLIQDLVEFRELMEPQLAALAAKRINAEQLQRLQGIIEEQKKKVNDPLAFLEADLRFHECISEAAGNHLSMEIIKVLYAGLQEVRLRSLSRTFNPEKSLAGHIAILEAIRLRDPQGAFAAMKAHLKDVEEAALGWPIQREGEER